MKNNKNRRAGRGQDDERAVSRGGGRSSDTGKGSNHRDLDNRDEWRPEELAATEQMQRMAYYIDKLEREMKQNSEETRAQRQRSRSLLEEKAALEKVIEAGKEEKQRRMEAQERGRKEGETERKGLSIQIGHLVELLHNKRKEEGRAGGYV